MKVEQITEQRQRFEIALEQGCEPIKVTPVSRRYAAGLQHYHITGAEGSCFNSEDIANLGTALLAIAAEMLKAEQEGDDDGA